MPTSAPPSLRAHAERVDARLAEVLDAETARWSGLDPGLADPVDEIRRLVMSGGKRLRPAFCLWGFLGAGGDPEDPRIVDAGCAFELMHAFALFHDDVMDDSATRRGAPTTHAVFGGLHADGGWAGEARRFGEGVSILVGDLAFVYADRFLAGASPAVWDMWNELRVELNVGQYLDLVGSVRRERRRVQAERICRFKSGKYTIERPLHLGALLASPERGAALLDPLSAYGLPLGDAFQMRDDVMGAFGDSGLTGKPVADDLREGKPTPLLARAVERASPTQMVLLDTVGDPDLDDATIAAIQQVIVDTGALADLERTIRCLAAEAIGALEAVRLEGDAAAELNALARYVTERTE